jgi:dolichyl-phosphate-mannose--protein O-mannosyl transferase
MKKNEDKDKKIKELEEQNKKLKIKLGELVIEKTDLEIILNNKKNKGNTMLKVDRGYVDTNKIVSIYTINDLNNNVIIKTLVGDTYVVNDSTLEAVKQEIEELK